jgi:DamX protein
MSALPVTSKKIDTSAEVSAININTRIDYILRFSKHPAVVIAEQTTTYSNASSQFLASLSERYNAAFISTNIQLTNIQLRCRIIEQLFAESIFDPELALYESVAKLAKNSEEPIAIVIEHAQFITRQMLHEICQLSELFKKQNKPISIVLFGNFQLGMLLVQEKNIFEKRVSVLSADTGQPLTITAKNFVNKSKNTVNKKLYIAYTVMVLMITGIIYFIVNNELLFTDKKVHKTNTLNNALITNSKEVFVTDINKYTDTTKNQQLINTVKQNSNLNLAVASPSEIANILAQQPSQYNQVKELEKAQPKDVMLALSVPVESNVVTKVNSVHNEAITDEQVYFSYTKGYVVQYGGFTDEKIYQQFRTQLHTQFYMTYTRKLKGNDYIVMTSGVYETKQKALDAIAKLPEIIQIKGPFIKSITSVQKEITEFNKNH